MKNTVGISNDFFVGERRNYSNWMFAFWRELFQNSDDAGANRYSILFNENIVTLTDNGTGMTYEVGRDVFFCLGKTTKIGNDSVGGFGRARVLTHFSQEYYEVRTQDWESTGSGASYDLVRCDTFFPGCQMIIHLDRNETVNPVEELKNYLSLAQMRCKIYSNEEGINDFKSWLHRRKEARRLSFGSVHVNKSGKHSYTLIVRVNGVPMFTRSMLCPYQIILEIDIDKSRDVLLSNRDSLHYRYQNELDLFIQTITVDQRTLRENKTKIDMVGDGHFTCAKEVEPEHKKPDRVVSAVMTDVVEHNFALEEVEQDNNVPATQEVEQDNSVPDLFDSIVKSDNKSPGVEYRPASSFTESNFERRVENTTTNELSRAETEFPCVMIYVETELDVLKRAAWRYNPKHWKNGQGRDTLNLLKMWTIACRYVVEELVKMRGYEQVLWRTGFLFSEEYEAMCLGKGGVHTFLFCPVDKGTGKKCFRLGSFQDRMRLISLALHEAVHIENSYHDEVFASTLTGLTGMVYGRVREIQAEMKNVLK
jgi:hypothetical protein